MIQKVKSRRVGTGMLDALPQHWDIRIDLRAVAAASNSTAR